MTLDALLHVAVALLIQVVVMVLFWLPFGLLAGAWAGGFAGAAAFFSREIAQAPYKAAAKGDDTWGDHINWPECYWPCMACGMAALGVTVFVRGVA